jgi:hypothetical protein
VTKPVEVRAACFGPLLCLGRPPEAARFRWKSVFARLGAGMDFLHISPQGGSAGSAIAVKLEPAHWSRALVVRPALGTSWAVGSRLAMDVRLFVDVLPERVHSDVSVDGARQSAFTPWPLRPGLVLALTYR